MKASELRIGNYVQLEGLKRPIRVSIIDTTETSTDTKAKPIPLTEEWLLKFGFKKDFNGYYFGLLSFSITRNNEFMICVNDRPTETICYSVHQLQNLYFALTGKELTLKS
jgi:hypothetical protein